MAKRSVLIETQYSITENYGGLLQAYALQRALRTLGYRPVTNTEVVPRSGFGHAPRLVMSRLLGRPSDHLVSARMKKYVYRSLIAFAEQRITTVSAWRRRAPKRLVWKLTEPEYAIAGSDQVWRPEYFDLRRGTFAYLPGTSVRKISYAASFGLGDTSGFDGEQLNQLRAGLAGFDSISVREDSAVDLCSEFLGMRVEQVLDPTMLFADDEWDEIARDEGCEVHPGDRDDTLAFVVLDPTEHALNEAIGLAEKLDMKLKVRRSRFCSVVYARAFALAWVL